MTPSDSPNPNRTRDHLANERTFLAWVRTALALIGMGFVLARMGLFLQQLTSASLTIGEHRLRLGGSHEFLYSGVVFLVLGTLLSGWSGWHYLRSRTAIETGHYEPAYGSVLVLTLILILGGLTVMGIVLLRTIAPGSD